MINRWMVTGDTHGQVVERLRAVELNNADEKIGCIILGDAGINFYLNKTDRKNKEAISACSNFIVYCVRGNHEERPQNIEGMLEDYDDEVDGYVYYEPDFRNIRYFIDGGLFNSPEVASLGHEWYNHPEFCGKGYKEGIERILNAAFCACNWWSIFC